MYCQWTTLKNGRLYCRRCDPDKKQTQASDTRRDCGPTPPRPEPPVEVALPHGVGHHLKRVLAHFLLFGKAGCRCDGHSATMDRNGPDWCAENIDTIIGWMRAEAKKRKLPFLTACAEGMILLAIHNARRDAAKFANRDA